MEAAKIFVNVMMAKIPFRTFDAPRHFFKKARCRIRSRRKLKHWRQQACGTSMRKHKINGIVSFFEIIHRLAALCP